ncbi:hypothetical protein ACQJBY_035254 [Aegilops geniculata]
MFKKAYKNIIYPCRDKTEWERMNGPPIKPPLYTKQVGRPCKSRRKAPHEVSCSNGGKKMSRHGVIMHCNYCGEPDHNIKGCKYLKDGLPPPNVQAPPEPHAEGAPNVEVDPNVEPSNAEGAPNVGHDEQVITQEHNCPENHVTEDLMVDHMVQNRPLPRVVASGPIPESTFICAARAMLNQSMGATTQSGNNGSSSTIQQGDLAKKLLLLKRQRDKELEDKKEALLAARREEQQKKAEEAARKRHQQEEKKALEAERKRKSQAEKREKRKEEAAIAKKAKEETRQIIMDTKRAVAAENKARQQAQKKAEKEEAAAKKRAEKEAAAARKRADRVAAAEARKEEMRLIGIALGKRPAGPQPDSDDDLVLPSNTRGTSMFDIFR